MMLHVFRNSRGVTLIELLVALLIFAFVTAGSYRLFVAQGRAYAVQEQVVEVQQNIRSAMEIFLRDMRMAGFDSDSLTSKVSITNSIVPGISAVTLNYEYDDTTRHTMAYWRDAGTSRFLRQLTTTKDDGTTVVGPQDVLLENVDQLTLSYGIDFDAAGNEDGGVDYWEMDPTKIGSRKVVAVRVVLTTQPEPVNPDIQKQVMPRTLESTVTLRNLIITH